LQTAAESDAGAACVRRLFGGFHGGGVGQPAELIEMALHRTGLREQLRSLSVVKRAQRKALADVFLAAAKALNAEPADCCL